MAPVYDYSNNQTLKNRSKTNNATRKNDPNATSTAPAPAPSTTPTPSTAPAPSTTLNAPTLNAPQKKTGGTRKHQENKKIYLGKHSKTLKK